MFDINEAIVEKDMTIKEIVETIVKFGFAIMPQYFSEDDISKIRKNHSNVMKLDNKLADIVDFGNGKMAQVKRKTLEKNYDDFDKLLAGLHNSFMIEVIKKYFSFFNIQVNNQNITNQFEVEHDYIAGKSSGSHLHFDRVPSLKISLYLNDTTKSNGALRVVPKSQFYARKVALSQYQENCNPLYQKNFVVNETFVNTNYIEAKAGSIVFLDTFCLHSGGELEEYQSRKVIRSVSWALPLNENYFRYSSVNATSNEEKYNLDFFHPHPFPDNAQIGEEHLFVK